jgi:hypothetical protein
MLTNIQLLLKMSHPGVKVEILTKAGKITEAVSGQDLTTKVKFKIDFPNRVEFLINNLADPGQWIEVQEIWIGSLKLPKSITCQIFELVDNNNNTHISEHWNRNGTVTVNLFAEDWVQYHLLYSNKISRHNS